jgi:hypothetical protein
MTFKLDEQWLTRKRGEWSILTDDLSARILATAKGNAPVSDEKDRKTGSKTGKTVTVEMTPDGPRLAKGSHKSASASRYIKTKDVSELKPIPDRPGFFTYTFSRKKKHLRDTGQVIDADEGEMIEGGFEFTAPYAKYVEQGWSGHPEGSHYMVRALDAHADEIKDGGFLKGSNDGN